MQVTKKIDEKSKQDIAYIFFFGGIFFCCLLDTMRKEFGLSNYGAGIVFAAIYLADKIVNNLFKNKTEGRNSSTS